jgi:hypothetical protein
MAMQKTSRRRFPGSGVHRTIDFCRYLIDVTPRKRRNALRHFAVLLCAFGLTIPRVEYAQTDKPELDSAADSGASGRLRASSSPMERLIDALAGGWATEITYEPGEQFPQGGSGRSRDSYRVGPARSSLIQEYHADGTGGKAWGTGVIWWDARAEGFRFVWCDSSAVDDGCRVSSDLGNWKGDAFTMTDVHEVAGKPVFEKEVWSGFTPNSFGQTLYVGDSRETLKKYMVIHARRIAPTGTISRR